MDNRPSIDLLESTHRFPGAYRIKVIGTPEKDFAGRIAEAVRADLPSPTDVESSSRMTPGGRHVALTLDLKVDTAAQVRSIYDRIRAVEGLTLLL